MNQYIIGHYENNHWVQDSKIPELLPKYEVKDERDLFTPKLLPYIYMPYPHEPDKKMPYWQAYGFSSEDCYYRGTEIPQSCVINTCICVINDIPKSIENYCSSCDKITCYTCSKKLFKCIICRYNTCPNCWHALQKKCHLCYQKMSYCVNIELNEHIFYRIDI